MILGKFKNKLRNWLGINQLDKSISNIWWNLNDGGHGLNLTNKEQDAIIGVLCEYIAHPKAFKWDAKGLVWKSPNWEASKKTWIVHANGTPYETIRILANHKTRDTNYG